MGSRRSRVCFMCDLDMVFVSCRVVMSDVHYLHAFIASVLGRSQCGHVPEGHAESMCVPWCVGRGLFTFVVGVVSVHHTCRSLCDCHWCDCRVVRLSFVCGCQCALVCCVVVICAIVNLFNFMCHVCDCHLRGHVIVRLSFVRLGPFNLICHMCDCHFCDVSVTL